MPTNRTSSNRSPNATPPRVAGGRATQPKTSRRTFVSCGACRMRRVRCDRKDAITVNGEDPVCTNCRERDMRCVDVFVEFRALKRLRRGRRLVEAEQKYGPASQTHADPPATDTESAQALSSRTLSCIPKLQPEFFGSPFYRRFHIQRPIVDPTEFSGRFYDSEQGKPESLGAAGSMICMLLVIWAATYGVNEYGVEEPSNGLKGVRERRRRCNEMVREILSLIDKHGVLRQPTWDGVRVLLLILPLTEDVQTQLERLILYEAMVSQVYTLCSLGPLVKSGQGEFVDALVRARIFWYGHVHEDINSGLRGGRLIFEDDDLSLFQITFSSLALIYLSSACRQVHTALTGPKAKRKEDVNERGLKDAWEALSRSWEEFEGLRHVGPVGIIQTEDTERFVNGWQIFIFECHNIIRESLKQRMIEHRQTGDASLIVNPEVSHEPLLAKLRRLHAIAKDKCQDVAGQVVTLIRRHLGSSLFQYDASLVRDGCFYAGICLAQHRGTENDIDTCVQALEEMRWAFSKSEERIATLKWAWENRMANEEERFSSECMAHSNMFPGEAGSHLPIVPVYDPLRASADLMRTTMCHGGASVSLDWPMHRPPRPTLVEDSSVNASPLTSVSEGITHGHAPFFSEDIRPHQNPSSTGAATILPNKMPPVPPTTRFMGRPFDDNSHSNLPPFMDSFDTTGTGQFPNDTFYSHTMPTHGMDTAGILVGGHGTRASLTNWDATSHSPSMGNHYAYYPHLNDSFNSCTQHY